tara:strand:- start:1563 stop:2249 length:687 start_codon:yes stop_codon:yes gene_type:complete
MNTSNLEFFLKENVSLSLDHFLINLTLAAILSIIVQIFYMRYSTTLSNKLDFSKNFVILGITTTIVITIVKSSLALSLGLVGALSIVRFRAAIKEPEELIYLFLVIAIGLGCGAGQAKIITIGTLFSLLTIFFYNFFYKGKFNKFSEILNLTINIDKNINDKEIDKIIQIVKNNVKKADLISLSKSKTNVTINLDIVPLDIRKISKLTNEIQNKNTSVFIAKNELSSF